MNKLGPLDAILRGLNSSYLVMIMAALFLIDLFVPDPVPFVDEAVLGMITILMARWAGRNLASDPPQDDPEGPPKPPPKNVTPPK